MTMQSIPETGTGEPTRVNFLFERHEAMIAYAPNGILGQAAKKLGEDRITTYIGKSNVVFSCDKDLAEEIISLTAQNPLEDLIQNRLSRFLNVQL